MMNNAKINQEARQIEDCCNKIESSTSETEVRQQIEEIRNCCSKIEQNC